MNEDCTDQLVSLMQELEVVKLVREHYAQFNNPAPPQLLERAMQKAQQSWDQRLGKEKVPDPGNDKAMGELHDFVSEWTKRHGLEGAKELYYLGLYLTGRLNVQVKLENLKRLYTDENSPYTAEDGPFLNRLYAEDKPAERHSQ